MNINIAIETSLFVSPCNLIKAMEYADIFYVDMKIMDKERCKEVLNGDLDIYLENLKILCNSRKK